MRFQSTLGLLLFAHFERSVSFLTWTSTFEDNAAGRFADEGLKIEERGHGWEADILGPRIRD